MEVAPIEEPDLKASSKDNKFCTEWGVTQEIQGDLAQLEAAIKTGIAIVVSDGSLQDQNGSAAWTIKGNNQQHQIVGRGRTPGTPDNQSAYRSKLFGLWGILHALQKFTHDRHITQGHMHIACDGLLAL